MSKSTSISETLRRVILASGESLAHIGRQTGTDHARLSRFVRGERSLNLHTADALAAYFGLTLTGKRKG